MINDPIITDNHYYIYPYDTKPVDPVVLESNINGSYVIHPDNCLNANILTQDMLNIQPGIETTYIVNMDQMEDKSEIMKSAIDILFSGNEEIKTGIIKIIFYSQNLSETKYNSSRSNYYNIYSILYDYPIDKIINEKIQHSSLQLKKLNLQQLTKLTGFDIWNSIDKIGNISSVYTGDLENLETTDKNEFVCFILKEILKIKLSDSLMMVQRIIHIL